MATNLVSLVMKFMTPDMIGRIAGALGLDRDDTSTAVGAAVPSLLAAFCGVATRADGQQQLVDASRQESGTLDRFSNLLGTPTETHSLAERGSQMLGSLLGSRDQSVLAGAISKYSGLSSAASSSVLGMLAPVLTSTIAQQQGTRGLNANGIASLLASQKDNIAAAMPSGFGRLIGSTGLLDSLGDAGRTIAAGGEATRAAAASVVRTIDNTRRSDVATSSAANNWLLWVIPGVAIAALLIYLVGRPAEQVVQQAPSVAQSLMAGGVDIGRQVTNSIDSVRTTLGGITDSVSAQAAMPKLQAATDQIEKASGLAGQLSEAQQKALAGLLRPTMSTLNQLFDKVLAIPGAAEVIKPTIDALKAKLAILTA